MEGLAGLLPWAQAVTAGGATLVLLWTIRELTRKDGTLAPRWYADQERDGRLAAEQRADKTLAITETQNELLRQRAREG